MLAQTSGIEKADSLSLDHIELALSRLLELQADSSSSVFESIDNSQEVNLRALIGLALKVKTRNH